MTSNEKIKRLGEQIRMARCKRRMSQDELGQQIGVSGEAVCHWETGKQAPTIKNLLEACRVLEIPMPLHVES